MTMIVQASLPWPNNHLSCDGFYSVQVRLGWHDSGTYDKNIEEWPQRGGADGSLRFEPELNHGANAGILSHLQSLHFLYFLGE
jgi:catalase (peroxidase I)